MNAIEKTKELEKQILEGSEPNVEEPVVEEPQTEVESEAPAEEEALKDDTPDVLKESMDKAEETINKALSSVPD